MKRFSPIVRRWMPLLSLLLLTLCVCTPLWAQDAANEVTNAISNPVSNAASNAVTGVVGQTAREGTPSFLSAVDTTLRLWSQQFQKLGIYAAVAVALVASYLTGLVLFQLLFASGGFAPRAASSAAWVAALVLLFCVLLLLPQTWPWWAPYALLLTGLLMIAVLISSLSKRAV